MITLDPKGLEAAMKAAIPSSKRFDLAATVAATIRAYLEATAPSGQAPLEGVKIKPLEWSDKKYSQIRVRDDGIVVFYTVDGSMYEIRRHENMDGKSDMFMVWRSAAVPVCGHNTLEAARAAAQADYEARIRAALLPASAEPVVCGLANPGYQDCKNMKEVGGGMEGERYRCSVCGKGYFLDYEDMK